MSPVRRFPNRFLCSEFQNDEEFNDSASAYTYMHVDCSRSSEAPVRSPDVVVSNNFMNHTFNDDQVMDTEEDGCHDSCCFWIISWSFYVC
ncbi:hypothetical protein HanXRQr2_Chr17g0804821 [Helianthus annuus]|uniref:Uncharacterized protein n=1 Tax=Helianthus annuus TaxID=4232 RepID=A0A9K3DHE3_HELAN|nr:hypothetical protein HanXRQr2_Chr17g0804821 [Helianthus annuus]